MQAVQSEFDRVCKSYFPTWRDKDAWAIEVHAGLPSSGRCVYEPRLIEVLPQSEWGTDEVRLILIHEICHAVCDPKAGHGEAWQEEMLRVASIAEGEGNSKLADLIREEEDEISKTEPVSSDEVSEIVEHLMRGMLAANVPPQWPRVCEEVAQRLGLESDEFVQRYPEAHQEFQQIKRRLESRAVKQAGYRSGRSEGLRRSAE